MRTYIIHLALTVLGVYLLLSTLDLAPSNALFAGLAFIFIYAFFWLLSYFYDREHFRKVPLIIFLFFYFLKEMIKANLRIAYDIVTPSYSMEPAVIALPIDAETDLEITLLVSLINLTPGTLFIDLTPDRKILYVHAMYIREGRVDLMKHELKHGFERRLLQITR